MKKVTRIIPICILVMLMFAGCAAVKVHPGAANTFDSQSYDTLLVTDSVIQSTKTDLASNAFPASIAGNVKTALNDLIKAYDAADAVYVTYHTAALAGTATATQQTAVAMNLNLVNSATTALAAAKGTK